VQFFCQEVDGLDLQGLSGKKRHPIWDIGLLTESEKVFDWYSAALMPFCRFGSFGYKL